MFRTDDPERDFDRHEAEKQALLDKLPTCNFCGEPIQDEYLWEIGEDTYCDDCMREHFRKENVAI